MDSEKIIKLYSVADGKMKKLEEIDDITFSSKMMGVGYAIEPANGKITSPVAGQVSELFPTNHVVGFKTDNLEVLLHMGINTVQLDGKPFTTNLDEGMDVYADSKISDVDLEMLEKPGISKDMIVIFINGRKVIKECHLYDLDQVKSGQEIGYVVLK